MLDVVSVRMSPRLDYDASHRADVLEELRALLVQMGADARNPLGAVVHPGDTVLVKPNLVLDRVSDPASALTNGVVIEAVCRLVLDALGGRGKVIVADVPLQSADFEAVTALNGLQGVMERFGKAGAPVALLDLRQERLMIVDQMYRGLQKLTGDPMGYTVVNLGDASELEPLGAHRSRFAVGDYDRESTAGYHMSSSQNEYLIPNTVLSADVVINLPKLKTHKKTGITCALKNLVGICGHKSYLPHYREGSPATGGDEFAVSHPIKELQRDTIDRLKTGNAMVYKTVRAIGRVALRFAMARQPADLRKVMAGSWYGNDTLWRTILDLNKIARYADKSGRVHETPQRRYFCIVDGIFSGEGDGPLQPTTRHDGLLLAGANPVLVDLVVCWLMGIDPEGVRQVRRAFDVRRHALVAGSYEGFARSSHEFVRSNVWPLPNLAYKLPPAWDGYVPRLAASDQLGAPTRVGNAT